MEKTRIIYTNEEGVLQVVIPAPDCPYTIVELAQKCVPQGRAYQIVSVDDLPKDRDFRGAWEYSEALGVSIQLEKAKEITKERLRKERKPILEELDVAFIQAMETGGDTTKIVAEKKRLRDITKEVENKHSPSELKQLKAVKEI